MNGQGFTSMANLDCKVLDKPLVNHLPTTVLRKAINLGFTEQAWDAALLDVCLHPEHRKISMH